jgi:hypothetical protein
VPTPQGTPAAAPATVLIYGAGAANAHTIVVTETGYAGTYTESDTCNPGTGPIATIALTSGSGASVTYTVTGISAGICAATFTDAFGQQTSSTIYVTLTSLGVQ